MKILNRYIGTTVLIACLLVILVVVLLQTVASFVDGLGALSNDFQMHNLLRYMMLRIPKQLIENLPYCTLVGCLMGLGTLASHSELIVMRTAGVSTKRVVWQVMRPVLLLSLCGLLLAEFVAHDLTKLADAEHKLKNKTWRDLGYKAKPLFWAHEPDGYVRIEQVLPNDELRGVTRYRLDGTRLIDVAYAEHAVFQGDGWELQNVDITHFETNATRVEHRATLPWKTLQTPKVVSLLATDPERLSLRELTAFLQRDKGQARESAKYWVDFWEKALKPLATLSLAFVAISFVFGPLRQVTMGYRIFAGVMVGVTFEVLQRMLSPMSLVYGFSPFWSMMTPILVCIVAGIFLLRRVD